MIEPQHDSSEVDEIRRRLAKTSTRIGLSETKEGNGRRASRAVYERSNLTRSQLQIWMGQNLLPEIPIYNLAVALNIHGEIDPVHFGKAFQTLVNSSDALRTVLEEIDGIPMQRLVPVLPYEISVNDCS